MLVLGIELLGAKTFCGSDSINSTFTILIIKYTDWTKLEQTICQLIFARIRQGSRNLCRLYRRVNSSSQYIFNFHPLLKPTPSSLTSHDY